MNGLHMIKKLNATEATRLAALPKPAIGWDAVITNAETPVEDIRGDGVTCDLDLKVHRDIRDRLNVAVDEIIEGIITHYAHGDPTVHFLADVEDAVAKACKRVGLNT